MKNNSLHDHIRPENGRFLEAKKDQSFIYMKYKPTNETFACEVSV
jgi:hypothetical protein